MHISKFSESDFKVLSQLGVIQYLIEDVEKRPIMLLREHITPVFAHIISKASVYIKVNPQYFDILPFCKSH